MAETQFTLDDFMAQLEQIRGFGKISPITKMIVRQIPTNPVVPIISDDEVEHQISQMRAIYGSMTVEERNHVEMLQGQHIRRIANGAGLTVRNVSQFMRQFLRVRAMLQGDDRTGQ